LKMVPFLARPPPPSAPIRSVFLLETIPSVLFLFPPSLNGFPSSWSPLDPTSPKECNGRQSRGISPKSPTVKGNFVSPFLLDQSPFASLFSPYPSSPLLRKCPEFFLNYSAGRFFPLRCDFGLCIFFPSGLSSPFPFFFPFPLFVRALSLFFLVLRIVTPSIPPRCRVFPISPRSPKTQVFG